MKFSELIKKIFSVSIATSAIAFLTTFLLSIIMKGDDFGLYTYYYSIFALSLNFMPFGVTMAVVVYMYQKENEEFYSILNNGIFCLMPLIFILSCYVLFLLPENLLQSKEQIYYVFLLALSAAYSLLVISYFRNRQNIFLFSTFSIFYHLLLGVSAFFAYYISESVEVVYQVMAVSIFSLSIALVIFFRKITACRFSYLDFKKNFTWSIKFGLPVVLSSLTMSFSIVGDKIILGGMTDHSSLASYSIAAFISSTTLFLVNNFASAWGSYLSKNMSLNSREVCFEDFRKGIKNIFFSALLIFLMLPIQLVIYYLFYEARFPDVELVIVSLTCAYFIYGLSKYFVGYMNYFAKNKIVFLGSILGVLIIFFSFMIFSTISFKMMSLSVLLGMLFQFCFCYCYTYSLMKRYSLGYDI